MAVISSIIYPVVPNDTQRVITEDYLEYPDSDSTFLFQIVLHIRWNSVEQHIEKYIKSQNTDNTV